MRPRVFDGKLYCSCGKQLLVDLTDFDLVSKARWSCKGGSRVRASSLLFNNRSIASVIINPSQGYVVDHINHDTHDNRRENLRACLPGQNSKNLRLQKQKGYKGVSWHPNLRRWQARITNNRETVHLGYYTTPEAAALAYNEAATQLHKEFAYLNNL